MIRILTSLFLLLMSNAAFAAADSYRWFHVTIETPWFIFLFLLPMVLLPAVIMAILYWKYAGKKTVAKDDASAQK